MSVFSRFRRRKPPYGATTDEERIARYVYLLNTLPASVIESAHASAFADVPPERRREMFERLRPFLADSERDAAAEDPTIIAKLVRRAEEHRAARAAEKDAAGPAAATTVAVAEEDRPTSDPRDAVDARAVLMSAGVMAVVANQVLVSSAITAYFTVGAGSLTIASDPAWVGATYDAGFFGPSDGVAGVHDGGSVDMGGIMPGGGYDGGGFGGFDGGGFGG
ncbi:hypothetical protein [Microbacterium sp. NPDC056569]|uniref:hypothetical protein n=1 Tax=Microbacterium sp. NPDC056569 TaxID=3345867 RepID=UPI00367091FA